MKITTVADFKEAVAAFVAVAPSLAGDQRELEARFAPINLAICGAKSQSVPPLEIPPSDWPACDEAIAAYKQAFR